jgi:glycolate oxidase FAD binding subunit
VYAALPAGTEVAVVADCLDRLRWACRSHGGSAVVLDAPAAVKEAVDLWGPVPALDLMRRVKDRFDPDHRLAPGRFVGGI